jgi:elongation factor G
LWRIQADRREQVDEVEAGDIIGILGLKHSITGDTLCDPRHPIILERLEFPEPVISLSIEPRTNADKERLVLALATLRREDPSFKYSYNAETGQTVIAGMGELHLEIVKNKLVRDMGLDVHVGKPKVAYKETIQSAAQAEGRFIRQTGGHGQYGHAVVRLEPRGRGEGYEFVDKVIGGVIPREYIRAVEAGVREALNTGVYAGFPVVDIRAVLHDGSYHEVDSSELAFKIAASMAVKDAFDRADPAILEPVMRVEATMPEEFMGDVIGDLNSRRGHIEGMESRGTTQVVRALVPLASMFGYATDLRSMTQGRATYSMEFAHYAEVPAQLANELIQKSRV